MGDGGRVGRREDFLRPRRTKEFLANSAENCPRSPHSALLWVSVNSLTKHTHTRDTYTSATMSSSADTVDEASAVSSSSELAKPQGNLNDRLFALRMKINQSRKMNREEVDEEYKRLTHSKRAKKIAESAEEEDDGGGKRRKAEWSTDEANLHQTVEAAEWEAGKRRQKAETAATYGLNAFTSDASYRAYEKRIKKLTTNAGVQADVKRSQTNSVSLVENPLDYGKVNTAVSDAALDRLSKDVVEREAQRKKFSRDKLGESSGDVDFINERNRKFNKKLRSAFDKYTVEIRQNLERGTAL